MIVTLRPWPCTLIFISTPHTHVHVDLNLDLDIDLHLLGPKLWYKLLYRLSESPSAASWGDDLAATRQFSYEENPVAQGRDGPKLYLHSPLSDSDRGELQVQFSRRSKNTFEAPNNSNFLTTWIASTGDLPHLDGPISMLL